MRTIIITGQYKKDLKLARKRHLPEDKLNEIILKHSSIQRRGGFIVHILQNERGDCIILQMIGLDCRLESL